MSTIQPDLFATEPNWPEGFRYSESFLSATEEPEILAAMTSLPFKDFEFRGFVGKRRVLSFGWRYDFNGGSLHQTNPIPDFLLPIRDRAAEHAGLDRTKLEHALLTEYPPGAAIGWHKDRPVFGEVIGISLLASCIFRFRRKIGTRWERRALTVEPRSIYLLTGPARRDWEHSIPAVNSLRYSITFRALSQ